MLRVLILCSRCECFIKYKNDERPCATTFPNTDKRVQKPTRHCVLRLLNFAKMACDRKVKLTEAEIALFTKEHENAKMYREKPLWHKTLKEFPQIEPGKRYLRSFSRRAATHLQILLSTYFCSFVHMLKKKKTLHVSSKMWILCSSEKTMFLPLEDKIHIFESSCNIFNKLMSNNFLMSN